MATETSRAAIGIELVRFDDGSKGIAIEGFEGVHMGFNEADVRGIVHVALSDMEGGETARLMTTSEICEAFNVTTRTVYRWKDAGRIHATKAGRRLLFNRDEVYALLERVNSGKDVADDGEALEQYVTHIDGAGKPTVYFEAFADIATRSKSANCE